MLKVKIKRKKKVEIALCIVYNLNVVYCYGEI